MTKLLNILFSNILDRISRVTDSTFIRTRSDGRMLITCRIFKNYSLALQKRKSNNLSGTNLMFEVQISKIMKTVVLIANFDLANSIVFVTGD